MVITSLGIFGFLSKAHLEHSISTGGTNELRISNLERQIGNQQRIITDSEKVLSQLDQTVQVLLDADRIRGRSGALATRKDQAEERDVLNQSINDAYGVIEQYQEELSPLQQEKLAIEVEVGPLKYIAELIYGNDAEDYFDEAVRIVILLLIFTFDPLAIVLLLAANQGFDQRRKEKLVAFDMDNVADIEDNLVDVDMSQYDVYEEVVIPEDDDVEEYETVVIEDDDGHGVDPTDILETARRRNGRRYRPEK